MKDRHGLPMLLLCAVPIVLALVLNAKGISLGWLLFLLCPLMHVFMHGHKDHHSHEESKERSKVSGKNSEPEG